jgi:energy-coupling factor transport system substrate-specific component
MSGEGTATNDSRVTQSTNLSRFKPKDLITIGIFAAIYFVVFTAFTVVSIVPIFVILVPLAAALVLGIPTILLLAKVPKFGVFTVFGAIIGLLYMLIGMGWYLLVSATIFAFIADLIMLVFRHKYFVGSLVAYVIFSFWPAPIVAPIWISTEQYGAMLAPAYGDSYAQGVMALATTEFLMLAIGGMILFATIGALLGKVMFKKHFVKAGII